MSAAAAPQRQVAPFGRRACPVAGVESLGAYTVMSLVDDGPDPQPGQFSMLATVERWGGGRDERPFLPRALSVLRRREGTSQYLLERVGPGTDRLCDALPGEEIWVTGPLGSGFGMPEAGTRAILAGGGVGIAPLAIWQDALIAAGAAHELLLGFRDAAHAEGAGLLRDAQVATDDGSVGHSGLVTDLLSASLDADEAATVYACGPPAMLEAIRALCEQRGVSSQLALEATMACGYGACFGCAVPLARGGYARVCVDGPVFDGALLGGLAES